MKNQEHRPKIIITGGAGFIGSHTVVELYNAGYEPIIVDNFSNSHTWVIDRLKQLTSSKLQCYHINCCDEEKMGQLFLKLGQIIGIIHFAAFKSVNESIERPQVYYQNNLESLQTIINLKERFNIPDLVFSSSATVYGAAEYSPISEDSGLKPATSPYGETKKLGEEMIKQQLETGAIILRYFNPIGAHPSGLIGELPNGEPQNLIPYITQTAIGKRPSLKVFGTDYKTADGTCVRDFIHVVDVAKAHVAALTRLLSQRGTDVFNIGTGKGNSVQEVIKTFESISGIKLPVHYTDRRDGDIESIYADCGKASLALHWNAKFILKEGLEHAWQWEQSLHEAQAEAA